MTQNQTKPKPKTTTCQILTWKDESEGLEKDHVSQDRKGGKLARGLKAMTFYIAYCPLSQSEKKLWNPFMHICNRINAIRVALKRVYLGEYLKVIVNSKV